MAINVFPVPSSAAVTPTGWTAGVAGTFTLSSTLAVGTYLIKTDSSQTMTITLVDSGGRRYAGTVRGGSGFITVATAVNQIIIPGSLTYPFGIEITPISVTQLAAPTSTSLSVSSTGVVTGTWDTAPTGATGAVLFTPTGAVVNFSSTASGATTSINNSQFNGDVSNEFVVAFKNSSGAIGLGSTYSLVVNTIALSADLLLVAGGGGGGSAAGSSSYARGYGGGAGGYRTFASYSLPTTAFTITVGGGGSGSTGSNSGKGSNSVLSTLSATGGGRGADIFPAGGSGVGGNGGSGGGASSTAGTGNEGGYTPAEGTNGRLESSGSNGNGGGSSNTNGTGTSNSITGTAVTYGVGGLLNQSLGTGGTSGAANTGNGGQSAYQGYTAGSGGSGIVVIAYPDTSPALTSIGAGLTYDQPTRAGYRVYRFTAGTGTVTI